MQGRAVLLYVAVATVSVAACSEHQPNTPTSPDLASGAAAVKPTCNYTQLKKDVDAEWPNSVGGATKDTNTAVTALLATMQQNQADSNVATATGFRIIESVAIAASTGEAGTSAAAGSRLTLDLLACMDVPATSVPGSFEAALGSSGAFGVRARTAADADPLYTHDRAWNVAPVNDLAWSAVATRDPPSGGGLTNPAVKQIFLISGQKGDASTFTGDILLTTSPSPVFQWNATPQQLFQTTSPTGPGIQITQCADLGFVQHNAKPSATIFASSEGTCDPNGLTAYLQHSPRSAFQRLRDFFTPEPAYALGGTGSSTKGSSLSPWGVINPGTLQLINISKPDKQTNQVGVPLKDSQGHSLSVTPLSGAGTVFGQSGAFVWLVAINNQGVNVVACNNWAYTNAQGVATFTNAYLNKAGGYTLTYNTLAQVASTISGGGPGVKSTGVTPFTTGLFNVKNGTVPNDGGCTGSNVFSFDPSSVIQSLPLPPGPPPN